jgi:hypothetical protein
MTFTDPDRTNPPRYTEPREDTHNSTMMWLGSLLAIALVVGGVIWATNTDDTQTASNPPATTTGQGGTAPSPAPTNR